MNLDRDSDTYVIRYRIEAAEKWRELIDGMPWIQFPADWQIQMIPPFGGATARFRVRVPGSDDWVSIYADHYDRLGYRGSPYWEVYPYQGDIGRCDLADVQELLRMIADRSSG